MTAPKERSGLLRDLVSILLIAGALCLSTPTLSFVLGIELLFSPAVNFSIVAAVPLFGALLSLFLLRRNRRRSNLKGIYWAASIGICASLLMAVYTSLRILGFFDPYAKQRATWQQVVESEEALLSLEPYLSRLNFAVNNLKLPDFQSLQVFDEQIEWIDLSEQKPTIIESVANGITATQWEVTQTAKVSEREELRLLSPLLESVSHFNHAKLYVVRGKFTDSESKIYETDLELEGSARLLDGSQCSIHGSINARWHRRHNKEGQKTWQLFNWNLNNLVSIETEEVLFEDVLDEAIPALSELSHARTSIHEQSVIESFRTGSSPYPHFTRASTDQHPGISVIDLNGDGFDDFYVMEHWGPNLFYMNNGDGTFSEVGREIGLAVDYTSSAVFADFDNDGDKDVFLGRTLVSSLYLENVEGHFIDRSRKLSGGLLPSLVSSVSAVDFDNDGLLDVYFSTYAAEMLANDSWAAASYLSNPDQSRLQSFLSSDQAHRFLNLPGPPNRLLRNLGGGEFEASVLAGDDLEVFKNSYQSTWADYDGDGDQDLYVANDFATNNLFRNDSGRFADVALETNTTDIGFGMGASWGDYDNNGHQDLYVSNMFSKAGRRITEQFDSLDPQFAQMARGNSLFRNDGESFDKVSGLERPAMMVEKAGWSWGGQFVDANNDGYLDIYALSGYYTSPRDDGIPDL